MCDSVMIFKCMQIYVNVLTFMSRDILGLFCTMAALSIGGMKANLGLILIMTHLLS